MKIEVAFPISIRFEDGTTETYDSVEGLETDLEVFDSESSQDVYVRDALGRRIRLRIGTNLTIEELSLIE